MQQTFLAGAEAYVLAVTSQVVFAAGVVHCCLNPDSILLTPGLAGVTAKVTGFEGSRLFANNSRLSCQVARTPYSAPEVLLGNLTAEADAWSLGSMICELLIGQVPLNDGKLYSQQCLWWSSM